MRSAAMSAWRSENVRTRSGFSARILLIFAEVKALTQGFSRRACGGRTTYPEMPTMRSCSPSRYSVSTVSSVRQTIRLGGNIKTLATDQTGRRRYQLLRGSGHHNQRAPEGFVRNLRRLDRQKFLRGFSEDRDTLGIAQAGGAQDVVDS